MTAGLFRVYILLVKWHQILSGWFKSMFLNLIQMRRGISTLDKIVKLLIAIVLLSLTINGPALAAGSSPAKGGKLPAISLPIPKDSDERNY